MTTVAPSGRWIAVIGSGRDGRVAVIEAMARALSRAGARLGGFVQRTRWTDDAIEGYDLVHPSTGEAEALAREDGTAPELCRWSFDEDAFARARQWTLDGELDVVFVEAGRLEAAKRGHWPTLMGALAARSLTVLSIRRGVLASVALELPDPIDAIELPAGADEVERFVARTCRHYEQEARP
ncbi:MAG: DUF2478 domain-containing protein [Sandaracinaceae bacterium]